MYDLADGRRLAATPSYGVYGQWQEVYGYYPDKAGGRVPNCHGGRLRVMRQLQGTFEGSIERISGTCQKLRYDDECVNVRHGL